MKLIAILSILAMPLCAALPPFAEAKREVKAILESEELAEFIPYSDCLEQIIKTENGYRIITNKREVEATIHYEENSNMGTKKFSIEYNSL
jgi:hypothetical protein